MSPLTLQSKNVAFNITLRQGDNVIMLQLMSQLMSQCDNIANNILLHRCWNLMSNIVSQVQPWSSMVDYG